ncbi:MAG: Gfo/Idh/MocA family oxidoreductase [Myxococcales bacterium]|nr:Gfo/Idh/MocA family oxidoreductase [Myxococcales bacterium]
MYAARQKPCSELRQLAVGLVGAGRWGRNYVRVLRALPDVQLRWICDVDAEARAWAHDHGGPGARVTHDIGDLFADTRLDALVIATPPKSHCALSLAALRRGLSVLVEKPMALCPREALRLEGAARASGRVLMVGHILRYHPAVVELSRLIAAGELGDVHTISSSRTHKALHGDEHALWALAPHDISLVRALSGAEPLRVAARGSDKSAALTLDLPHGARAEIELSLVDSHRTRLLRVVGSRGSAVFDDTRDLAKLVIYDADGRPHVPRIARVEPLQAQCAHFVYCAMHNVAPRSGAVDGLAVARVVETAARSMALDGLALPLETEANRELVAPLGSRTRATLRLLDRS